MEIMMIERSDFGEVSKRRISINTMERSGKTSWGLTSTTMEQEIMTLLLVDG
jgi:hypothetical protein